MLNKTTSTMKGAKHIEEALKIVEPGSRLVGIVGEEPIEIFDEFAPAPSRPLDMDGPGLDADFR